MHRKISIRHHNRTIRGELAFPRAGRKPWPAVLLVHGRGVHRDYPAWLPRLNRQLQRQGFATLAIDLNGHGRSDGQFEDLTMTKVVQDIAAAHAFLSKRPEVAARSIGAIGHSMGGNGIVIAQAQRPLFKACAVVASPLDALRHLRQAYPERLRRMWKREGRLCFWSYSQRRTNCLRYQYYRDWLKYDLMSMADDIHQPMLLVHGTADTAVAARESQAFAHQLECPHELRLIPGANHNFDGRASQRQVAALAAGWMKRRLLPRVNRSVVVFIRRNGKILMFRRSRRVWFYPNAWAVIGGHVPDGADPIRHAFVELKEETGYRRSDVRLARVGRQVRLSDPTTGHVWLSVPILVELKHAQRPKLDWEHVAYRWVEPRRFPFRRSYAGIRKQFQAVGLA